MMPLYRELRSSNSRVDRVHLVRYGQKNWRILSNISGYTGPIFAIYSPYEKALGVDDGICQVALPWQPNNVAIKNAD